MPMENVADQVRTAQEIEPVAKGIAVAYFEGCNRQD